MPQKVSSPELHEPYENYLYADLRHELSVRHIRLARNASNRANFIKLLRKWDKNNSSTARGHSTTQTMTRRTSDSGALMSSMRSIRARRGCRFRLINVLLSPEFNGRWDDMTGILEVNQLWLDVHAAFVADNVMLDAVHFQDALFVNVTPNVVLPHSASRLLQMWMEIVAMYRNAVAQAKEAAANTDNTYSFFDFCAGRLDLLYLHMAMLLEPKLYEFILTDRITVVEPFSRSKANKTLAMALVDIASDSPEGAIKAVAPTTETTVSAKVTEIPVPTYTPTHAATAISIPAIAEASPATFTSSVAAVAISATPSVACKMPTQNPEMEEVPTPVAIKSPAPVTATPSMMASAKFSKTGIKTKQTQLAALPQKLAAQRTHNQKAAGKGKTLSGAESAYEVKSKVLPSKQPTTAFHAKSKAASKPRHSESFVGDKLVDPKRSSLGKRVYGETDIAIVEIPSVIDIVPHPGKRVHTRPTISTALAPRSTDIILPPDEWDILESRLRKVNENIDRCHARLAGVEVTVNDTYKQSLEADLRFYSAIKQRLQEQLLVVMQSGY